MLPVKLLRHASAALPLIALLASCQKEEASAPVTELTLRDELTFSILPGSGTELDLTTAYDAQASVNAFLREQGFRPDQLRDVRIEDARAVMIEPVNAPFHLIQAMRLEFTEANGARIDFAHLDPVPQEQSLQDLLLEHEDLTPFFREEAQTIHARFNTTSPTGNDTTRVRFALTFRVKAGE